RRPQRDHGHDRLPRVSRRADRLHRRAPHGGHPGARAAGLRARGRRGGARRDPAAQMRRLPALKEAAGRTAIGASHPVIRCKYPRTAGQREETMRVGAVWLAGLAAIVGLDGARAAEIKVLCSNGLREVMLDVAPEFERATGHKLNLTFGLAAAFKQKIEGGEPFDVVVLVPALLDDVVKQGKVTADSRAIIARAGNGLPI